MALSCRIVNGLVEAPNGKASKLFNGLSERFDREKAMELYALTETEEYKDALFLDVDSNGEMTINNFLRFIYRGENEVNYGFETVDLQHKMSVQELSKLSSLFKEGIFTPTYDNLSSIGTFTQDEIYEILYSQEKQQNLKEFIENFETVQEVPLVEDFVSTENIYNEVGVNILKDPEIVKKEVLSILSDASTQNEVDIMVKSIPNQNLIDKYNNDPVFKQNLVNAALNSEKIKVEKDIDQTLDTILNTLDMELIDEAELSIIRIEQLNDKDLILEEFENLQDNLINAGLEIKLDEYELSTKSINEIKSFTTSLQNLISNPNIESTSKFSDSLDQFTQKPNTELIDLSGLNINSSNLLYIDSKQNEIVNFEEKSIIKVSDNLFVKVKDNYNLDQLYNALYSKVVAKPSIIPNDAILSAIEEDGLSLEILRDEVNKEFILEDLKEYVQSKADTLPKSDMELKEKIILYKTFYEIGVKYPENTTSYNQENNREYLQSDFASDFNKEILKNKKDNTKLYNYFYKFFQVDHKGIRPINDSTYTESYIKAGLNEIPQDIKNNLIGYAGLSKFFNLELAPVNSDLVVEERLKVQQNPFLAPIVQGDYQLLDDGEILTNKETEQFVRIEDTVYERILDYNNTALYKSLPKGTSIFKPTNTEKPITNKTVDFLRENQLDTEYSFSQRNYTSAQELEEINKEKFDCQ